MNLQFEHHLDYQRAAIEAVCGLFASQELCRTEFSVSHSEPHYGQTLGQSLDFAGQVSFDTPLKFIFSHSALREINTERERRQTIGRGLCTSSTLWWRVKAA